MQRLVHRVDRKFQGERTVVGDDLFQGLNRLIFVACAGIPFRQNKIVGVASGVLLRERGSQVNMGVAVNALLAKGHRRLMLQSGPFTVVLHGRHKLPLRDGARIFARGEQGPGECVVSRRPVGPQADVLFRRLYH